MHQKIYFRGMDYETHSYGALSGLMLDLGLLKIILVGVFFLFLAPAGALNLRAPFLISFLALRGKANPYLT